MVQQVLPWDALFLAGFAYSGYRTLGRWLKYTDDVAKSQSDGAYLEGFREYLSKAAQSGDRSKPNPGAGAEASGQAHLWRDFGGMKTKQRVALLQEMQQVLEWTGQDGAYRELVKHRGKPWASLPHSAKKALLAAADQLDWSFLTDMAQNGAVVASSSLWQITEAVPLLSAEPSLAEALLDEGQGLVELVASADIAVNALLNGQQEVVISALSPAKSLNVADVKRQLDLLREAVQGGLGLGSGGKASRGQQVLELLRGLDLTPAAETDQEAKAAAAAALDAAADEAVAPLKQQHATALTNATAAARQQALISALNSRIRFSAGKAPLTAAVAAAVIDTAADELTAALADAGAADSGSNAASLSARRLAAERVMGTASVIDSTAAALAAALGEDLAGEDEGSEGLSLGLQKLSDAAAAVQDSAIKVIEVKFNKQPAKAAAAAATEEDDTESTEAAEDKAAAAVAALEEALQAAVAAVAAVAALPGAQGGEGEGEGEGSVTKEGVQSEILKEVDEAVAAVEEKTKTQQETALQTARTRERMSLLLAKAKKLTTPATPAAAAAAGGDGEGGEGGEAEAAEPPMSPAEKLQVTEEFLKQLGSRPLAAALTDLEKLVAAQAATLDSSDQAGPERTAASLAAGIELQPDSSASLEKLSQLLSEIQLADAVMKLDLGPDVTKTLDMLAGYLEAFESRAADVDAGRSTTPPTPSFGQQKIVAAKCGEMLDALRGEGLIQLGLSALQYRQLAALREAAATLSPDLDALKYDRCVTALKDVSSQLGPIGASIQTKLAQTTDEGLREVLTQQKQLALELYEKLQAFLTFEQDIRGPLKKSLRELASLAGGIGAPRTPSTTQAAALKLDFAVEEAQKLQDLLAQLATSKGEAQASSSTEPAADSVAATLKIVTSLQGSMEAMQATLDDLSAHVALRARALNPEVAQAAAAAGVTADDLGLMTLEQMEPQLGQHLTVLDGASDEQQLDWERAGFEQIARGRVAAVLIATTAVDSHALNPRGEDMPIEVEDGTPRVAVPVIGLPSGKSTLQLLAERILKVQQLAASETFGRNAPVTRHVQWYIMTSPATHDKLASLLKSHAYFGLQPSQVTLFKCSTAPPAFGGDPLRALMLGPATLSRGTPGSGEVFAALKRSGALGHMKRNGIRHVEINAVDDNVLARPADPMLIGFCVAEGFDAAAKVVEPDTVPAVYAAASTGEAAAEGQEASGAQLLDESLSFLAPGIGSYYFSIAAVNLVAQHMADNPLAMYRLVPGASLPSKAPPPQMTVNLPPNATQAQRMQAQQALIAAQQAAANAPPKQVEGWVPTRCISDLFAGSSSEPMTPSGAGSTAGGGVSPLEGCRLAFLGVAKFQEFSPLLSTGPHLAVPHLDQAAGDLLSLTTGWVEEQGGIIECEEGVEVAPLVSYSGENLEAIVDGTTFAEPYDLALQGATGAGKPKHNAGPWSAPILAVYAVGAGLAVLKQLSGNRS